MNIQELSDFIEHNNYQTVEEFFIDLKKKDKKEFKVLINRTKVIFINTDDSNIIDGIAMIYHEFKIHSAVPIIVSKIITYDKFSGGTMAYALKGLRLEGFTEIIRDLLDLEISFEMRCMIDRLDLKS